MAPALALAVDHAGGERKRDAEEQCRRQQHERREAQLAAEARPRIALVGGEQIPKHAGHGVEQGRARQRQDPGEAERGGEGEHGPPHDPEQRTHQQGAEPEAGQERGEQDGEGVDRRTQQRREPACPAQLVDHRQRPRDGEDDECRTAMELAQRWFSLRHAARPRTPGIGP